MLEYEYEAEMESAYRQNMLKSFKKTIDDGFFPFIIVDAVFDRTKHFEEFWSYAKSKGFQVPGKTLHCFKRIISIQKSNKIITVYYSAIPFILNIIQSYDT